MIWVPLLLFLTICGRICLATDKGDFCITPNGDNGTCILGKACQVIVTSLLHGEKNAIQFAKRSQCGFEDDILLCCGVSGHFLFDPSNTTTETLIGNGPIDELPNTTLCGIEKETNRIVGGIITEFEEFPWMVALEYKNRFIEKNEGIKCGGALINNQYVLTAAHCLYHVEFEIINAWLGDWNLTSNPDCKPFIGIEECADPIIIVGIEKIIVHQSYSSRQRDNDIGLLKLKEYIRYTDYIRPVCIPTPVIPPAEVGMKLTVVGWGLTENGTVSEVKLKVDIPFVDNEDCKERLQSPKVTSNQMCAGGEVGEDSCQGDSGGPLMRYYEIGENKTKQWYLDGVVAWGMGCGRYYYPGVYTRVSCYADWITDSIRSN